MTERSEPGPGEDVPPDEDRPDLTSSGPASVFGRLFDAYAPPLHSYLARRVDADIANDLVAETFLNALDQRDRYDPGRASVRSWLYGIATNLLRRHIRQEVRGLRATARLAGRTDNTASGHEGRVADRVDAQVMAQCLAGALAELNPADRDTLLLVSWAGLDTAEVAEALDVPVGTVRSRLHRVRRRLRASAPAHSTSDGDEDDHA